MRDKPEVLIVEAAAAAAYSVHRAYRAAVDGEQMPSWGNAVTEYKNRLRAAARKALEDDVRDPEENHRAWVAEKEAEGWTVADGPRDEAKKKHPHMVPWELLPDHERSARALFLACVHGAAAGVASAAMAEERALREKKINAQRELIARIQKHGIAAVKVVPPADEPAPAAEPTPEPEPAVE